MAIAFGAKVSNNELDNQQNVFKIAKLRFDRAQLLDTLLMPTLCLKERMAESPEKVNTFSKDLLEKAKPAALKEFAFNDFHKKLDGLEQLEKWDGAYYSEKLKQELFSLDDEKLKYFQLEKC
jgi:peptidyl-dipeptidase Dcp